MINWPHWYLHHLSGWMNGAWWCVHLVQQVLDIDCTYQYVASSGHCSSSPCCYCWTVRHLKAVLALIVWTNHHRFLLRHDGTYPFQSTDFPFFKHTCAPRANPDQLANVTADWEAKGEQSKKKNRRLKGYNGRCQAHHHALPNMQPSPKLAGSRGVVLRISKSLGIMQAMARLSFGFIFQIHYPPSRAWALHFWLNLTTHCLRGWERNLKTGTYTYTSHQSIHFVHFTSADWIEFASWARPCQQGSSDRLGNIGTI